MRPATPPHSPEISPEELAVMQDRTFLQLKHSATQKVLQVFGNLQAAMKEEPLHGEFGFPIGTDAEMGKITKGENHQQLPYMVLDFPRLFGKQSVFACRTLFWWGHEFSFTLLLSGLALQQFLPALHKNFKLLLPHKVFVSVANTPWQHEFSPQNYQPCQNYNATQFVQLISAQGFCKLAFALPLPLWQQVPQTGAQHYRLFLQLLSA